MVDRSQALKLTNGCPGSEAPFLRLNGRGARHKTTSVAAGCEASTHLNRPGNRSREGILALQGGEDVNLGLPSQANPGPVHRPASHPHLLPQPWRRQNRKRPLAAGFTLVELLIAVVIIGVLSGVAMPAFLGQQNKAKINAANVQARGLMSYCLAHFIDNGEMPDSNDAEYRRLSKDPKYTIITWTATPTENKCEVRIEGNKFSLNPEGIFSIEATGDATTIIATPAKAGKRPSPSS